MMRFYRRGELFATLDSGAVITVPANSKEGIKIRVSLESFEFNQRAV